MMDQLLELAFEAIGYLTVIILVVLNYYKDIKLKNHEAELINKQTYYANLIDTLNQVVFAEDNTHGRDFRKLYNNGFIYASDEVLAMVKEMLYEGTKHGILSKEDTKLQLEKILIACRKDISRFSTSMNKTKSY